MLKVKELYKKYPGEKLGAVNKLSFEMKQGEILSFVGYSGSGKTTMLRLIAGLMKPDEGSIIFNGKPLMNPEEQLIAGHEKIKLVHQDYQLKPNVTVRENINYQLLHFDKDYQRQRTDELLALCKLEDQQTKEPRELSGGQQQRLAIARALSEDPDLLLLDEPFSSLDPMTKEDLLFDLLQIIEEEEIGLILVTHDTADALKVSSRIGYISDGELLQFCDPLTIYKQPKNLEIAQFFGRVNEIFFDGDLKYLRAEDLHVNDLEGSKLNLELRSSNFIGKEYLNTGQLNSSDQIIWFYSQAQFSRGDQVTLTYRPADFLDF